MLREDKDLLEISQEIENISKDNNERAKEAFLKIFDNNCLTYIGNNMYLLNKGLKPSQFVVYAVVDNRPQGATLFT